MNDQPARDRILDDLSTNLLVEAGAGSGKTTALVGRLLSHVRRGTPVDALAAVTFTRKAANELRERFQLELEKAIAAAPPGEARDRLTDALADLDRAFVGTIHAFCGRLLREHALDAGLDPAFDEIDEDDWPDLVERFWADWTHESRLAEAPDFLALRDLRIDPATLLPAFTTVVGYPDARFPAEPRPAPDVRAGRRRLERLLDRAEAMMPAEEPSGGWDKLQTTVRALRFRRRALGWEDSGRFLEALELLSKSGCGITQKSWSDQKAVKAEVKELAAEFLDYVEGDAAVLLGAWREHRYHPVMGLLQRAAEEFARRRRRDGQLGFEDLLERCAYLLREVPGARAALGARYRHLLVDEFQDTDPIQAEVCFLLASDPGEGPDWRRVTPRPGALFVVGDPKQSIYRFRRADIQTYELVKRQLAARGGAVLTLTQNFRSTSAIAELVNRHFAGVFPAQPTDVQAAFSPLESNRAVPTGEGIHRLVSMGKKTNAELLAADADRVASWIAGRIRDGTSAGSFLVLTWHRAGIDTIARALGMRNVAVQTTGAPLPQETELRELVLLLRALAAPENTVLVAAVLEGLFFGMSPADLFAAREAGLQFRIGVPQAGTGPVADARKVLHGWWSSARSLSPDALLDRLLDETGLLPWATSQPLGEARAGALLRLVATLRAGAADGVHDLATAIRRLEGLLERRDTEDAPLRPGRSDAVRVMNLHKAKGLEAEVVLLAAPIPVPDHEAMFHVARAPDGGAEAFLLVCDGEGHRIAQPADWDRHAAAEDRFLAAEQDRLLYVATTRACRELVVSQYGGKEPPADPRNDESPWSALREALADAPALAVPVSPPEGRLRLEAAEGVIRRVDELPAWLDAARQRSWRRGTVTESARMEREQERDHVHEGSEDGRSSRAWGRAVHRTIEALGRGRRGASLHDFIRGVVLDEALGDEHVALLGRIAERLLASDAWRELTAGGTAAFELPVALATEEEGVLRVREGVVDAAATGPSGWRVIDWKTGDAGVTTAPDYQAQVQAYASILAALTGSAAQGSIERIVTPAP